MSFVKKCLFLLVIFVSILSGISVVYAQTPDIANKIKEYEQKLNELGQQKNTLSSQIQQMDTQISLAELQVQRSEQKIIETQNEIEKLGSRIDNLDSSLNTLSKLLLKQIARGYKTQSLSLIELLFEARDMSDLTNKIKYQHSTQNNNQKLLVQVQEAKSSYEEQKVIREQKKQELDQLIISLNAQKAQLKIQQDSKRNLLSATQNDESTYQILLENAKKELQGFSAFTSAAGGSTLTSFGNGSNGWYYTQRDPQWGNLSIGGSSYPVWQAGCALTSVAMVCKKYGQNITPTNMALDSSKYVYGSLYNDKFNCDGKQQSWLGSSLSAIRSYVENGTPVILRLVAPSVSGLHFVVAWKWENDDLIIHDPYYGPDLKFTSRYSYSQITNSVAIY